MDSSKLELWNPRDPLEIDADQFEKIVADWLRKSEPSYRVTHQAILPGSGREYALDALAEGEIFGGAKIRILIECKKHARPINRDTIHTVHSKVQTLGLSKAIVFSTSGFQRGAIDFASQTGIGLVTVRDGQATYVTRSAMPIAREKLPYWLPEFAGELLSSSGDVIHVSTISNDRLEALGAWLLRP